MAENQETHSSEEHHLKYDPNEATARHPKSLLTKFVPVGDLNPAPLPGDLIEFNREMYSHWALYVGDGKVIHVRGGQPHSEVSFTGQANVQIDDLEFVAGSSLVRINNQEEQAAGRGLDPLPVEELIENARKMVGSQVEYDLFRKNCEHYVTEWRYGEPWSDQIENGMKDFHNLAEDVRRERLPQMRDALQNYLKSRAGKP